MHLHKSWLFIISLFILLSFTATSQKAEDEAIKKAIADQETAFAKRDVEAWKSSWVQDASASRTYTNMFVSNTKAGWNNLSEGALKYLTANPKPDTVDIKRDSFAIRREGNLAVVDYKQEMTFPNAQPPFGKAVSREQRVMVKKNGKWLTTAETSTDITGLGIDGVELNLNAVGYTYMYAGKNDEAIKVLELNTQLFPNSFNVWDSLGEAYAKAGNKEKAIECYTKSLDINPANETGKKALADLK